MNFDIKHTQWYKVEGLVDNSTYLMQAKILFYQDDFKEVDVLFTQATDTPPELDDGILASGIKFKKRADENIYIRAITTPVNIQIEAV